MFVASYDVFSGNITESSGTTVSIVKNTWLEFTCPVLSFTIIVMLFCCPAAVKVVFEHPASVVFAPVVFVNTHVSRKRSLAE